MNSATSPSAPAHSRLEHLPIGLFAACMGLAGLALAWRRAAAFALVPASGFWAPLALAMLVFAVLATALVLRWRHHPQALRADWANPVKLSFFGAITISLILFGTALAEVAPETGFVLWSLGASAHLALTLTVMRRWILSPELPVAALNPAWFIPVVGNILVPLAGVDFGLSEISWFFFAVGIFFWPLLLALVLHRVFFHAPLPPRLQPTFFILLAPPAVGFVTWMKLTGEFDTAARVLVYVAAFFLMLLATKLPALLRLPFAPSWWAYSFPLAASTVAAFTYADALARPAWSVGLATVLLATSTIVITALCLATARDALSGALFAKEG